MTKKLQGICKQCGICCSPITMGVTKKQIRKRSDKAKRFILKHWKRISREKAAKMNPYIAKKLLTRKCGIYCYVCDLLDTETGRCLYHTDDRIYTCTQYPYYREKLLSRTFGYASKDCTYYKHEKKRLVLIDKVIAMLKSMNGVLEEYHKDSHEQLTITKD